MLVMLQEVALPKHKVWLKRCQRDSEERDTLMQPASANEPAGLAELFQRRGRSAAAARTAAPAADLPPAPMDTSRMRTPITHMVSPVMPPAIPAVAPTAPSVAAAASVQQPSSPFLGQAPIFPLQGLPTGTPVQNAVLQAAMFNFLMMGNPHQQPAEVAATIPQLPIAALQRMFATFAQAAAAVAAGTFSGPLVWPDLAGGA